MKTITLDQVGETIVKDLSGRVIARIVVDEIGPNWQATVISPGREEEDDEGFTRSEHYFTIATPY
jgi:hypothetical protein